MKQGWTYKKLGEIARVQNGFAFDSNLFNESGKGTPLIRIRDIKKNQTYTYTTEICLKEEFYIENGDLLIGMDGDFNVCTWEGGHAYLNQRVCHVVPSDKVLSRYLYYLLPFPLKLINDKTTFATVKHLSSKQVCNILIPLPSIDEQQRIVKRLDSAFAHIDTLKANAEKQLREARALFQKSLDKALCNKQWKKTLLNEICIQITDGTHRTPKYTNSGIPFLSVKNVTSGFIDMSNTKFISKEEHLEFIKRCNPEYGDILYTKVGTTGVAKVIDVKQEFSIFVSLALLKINESVIFNRFLEYVLNSPYVYKQSQKLTSGAANKNFLLNDIKKVELFLPPLSEQQYIVKRLDSLSSNLREFENIQRKIIAECDALKQALLRKVFE